MRVYGTFEKRDEDANFIRDKPVFRDPDFVGVGQYKVKTNHGINHGTGPNGRFYVMNRKR